MRAPGQGVEPRSPRSERGVLPVRRSRTGGRQVPLRPSPPREIDAAASLHLVPSLLCLCHSPTLRPWIAGRRTCTSADRRPTWRSFGARASYVAREKGRQKRTLMREHLFGARRRGSFSLRRGLDSSCRFFKLGITSSSGSVDRLRNDEGDPLGRPRLARSAARELARTPPSEGQDDSGPQLRVEAVGAA